MRDGRNRKTILLCALIILQFVFLINFWSEHLFNSAMFESDAATEILLAEQCANEGKIIADDWYYSTELRVLHNHLVHTPVYALTGSFRKTYTISDLIIALLISASVFFLLSSAQLSLNGRLLGVLLFLVPYGGWKRYSPFSVFLGADYYSFFIIISFSFIALYFYSKRYRSGFPKWLIPAIMCILAAAMGVCGIRYALLVFCPLLIYEIFYGVRPYYDMFKENHDIRRVLSDYIKNDYSMILSEICYAAGFLAGGKAFEGYAIDYTDRLRFSTMGKLIEQLQAIITAILEFTGFAMNRGRVTSLLGILSFICLLYVVFLIMLFYRAVKTRNDYPAFLAIQAFFYIFVMLFTENADMGATGRYVWLGIAGMLLLPAFFVDDVRNKAVKPFVIVVCLVILAVNDLSLRLSYDCYSPAGEAYIDGGFSALHRDATPDKRSGYIAYLEQNGYTFGYSTFWQANITTVLTEGRVRLLSVHNNQFFDPYNWLTRRTYTEQLDDYPPQFILLTLYEEQTRLDNGFEVYGEEGYRDETFVVYVR